MLTTEEIMEMEEFNIPYPIENGKDGIYADSGSALARVLGFHGDLFHGTIEVCQDRKTDRETIYLHYINSIKPRRGNVKNLLRTWISQGFDVRIVRPEPAMINIIEPMGFVLYWEDKNGTVPKGLPAEIWRIPSEVENEGSTPSSDFPSGTNIYNTEEVIDRKTHQPQIQQVKDQRFQELPTEILLPEQNRSWPLNS